MVIEPSIWSKVHGASTHFPIALMLVSAFCDCAGLYIGNAEQRRTLRSTASITIILGALGSYGAVGTGLIMTKWQGWGHGALLHHHQFVWPAFALMTGLATWRAIKRETIAEKPPTTYLILMLLTAALMGGAGYWGGELVNAGAVAAITTPRAPAGGITPRSPSPERGRRLFVQSCAHCHGDDARGNGEDGDGPDLFALRIGNARIATVIRGGIPDEMPSFAKKHGPADIADLTGYLRTLQ
ncbi:MAG: cytochrome c [Chthoniobacter sp.]|nr:cytochrome c [Chthoniobacter sp.]